jgi:hypothetical protein
MGGHRPANDAAAGAASVPKPKPGLPYLSSSTAGTIRTGVIRPAAILLFHGLLRDRRRESLFCARALTRVTFSEQPLIYRVARGVRTGLVVGAGFSLWAAFAYGLKDAQQTEAMGVTLREAVAAYLLGGLFGGAFAGAMIGMMRWAIGAFVLGFIANLPTALVIAYFVAVDVPLPGKISIGVICACIGGVVALYIRSDPWPGLM